MAENYKSFDWSMLRADKNKIYPTALAYWGPYNSIASAFETIAGALGENIPLGLKFGVISGNKIEEYWFQTGYTVNDIVQCNASEEEDKPYIVDLRQTVESTESGGLNVWTATMNDGTIRQFNVRNGQKGEDGEDGQDGEGALIAIDNVLDINSENPVQNKVVTEALNSKSSTNHTHTTSQISDWNDATANFITEHQDLSGKQDKLTAGQNITIDENNVISASTGGATVTVDSALSTDSTNPVQNKVITTALNAKADSSSVPTKTSDLLNDSGFITSAEVPSSSSNFIGVFGSVNDLPIPAASGNYAYVENTTTGKYDYYYFNGTVWSSTGATVDTNNLTADEEDITASEVGVLSLKDRDTTYSSKAYVRVRKNLLELQVKKIYASTEVTWVHGVESTARTESTATTATSYNSSTQYYNGNPADYDEETNPNGKSLYGTEERFPFATNTSVTPNRLYKSVRKSAPFIMLNTADNKVYFKWQYNTGSWSFSDIYYNEWAETPSNVDFSITDGKVFAYVSGGITHYIRRNGNTWETDGTETKTINYLESTTFSTPDTIYEIVYDMDLNGGTIKPASGVVLKYAGGKIKNGTIDFSSGNVIIDCPDVQFFENIKVIKSYSQVMKDVWFDDIWMSITVATNVALFTCTAISLSKNHKVDFKHGEISVRDTNVRKLTIYGNGYKLTIDNTYRPSGGQLFACSAIAIYDLNIELTDKDIQTYNAIFNTANILMRNVTYKGYSRFAANWNNDSYSLSALELHDCDLRSTSFLFENSYNKVRIYNSQLRYLNPLVRHYYELISIGAYINPAKVENCNVEVYDSYIGGVWEIGDRTKIDGIVNSYGYMKFHNCELVRFTTDNSQKTRGITDIIYEDCHFKTCDLPWRTSCISTVTYKNCWFDIFGDQVGMTDAGPFDFWNIKSATFEGCTFNNTSFTDTDVTVKNGTSYPLGYTYQPYSGAIITIAPPANIVTSGTGNVLLVDGATWDFKLYLLNNRIMVNNALVSGYSYRPYSHFAIRTVNPNSGGAANKVILTDEQIKNLIVSRGNTFMHSISGTSGRFYESVGCHMYFNSRENVIPVDNTVFTVTPSNSAARDIDYANTHFGCCNANFTFIEASTDVPRYGRYNAATNKVAWLTYSAEEDVPNV